MLGRILVVDDEFQLMEALVEALNTKGYLAKGFVTGVAAIEALQAEEFDLLLTDLMMPGMDGIALLRACMAIDPNLVGIIMTGQGTVSTAVEAMKTGAFDYVLKPFRLEVLLPVLARAREMQRLRLENIQLRDAVAIYHLSQTIALSLDSKVVLEKTADAALQQVEADEVSIMLLLPKDQELYIAAIRGKNREHLLGYHQSLQEGIAGWVARHAEPLILNGEVSDPRFAPIQPRSEIRSAISIPMMTAGKLIGVLNVNSLQVRHSFTPGQVKALSILTNTAAAALENESLYEDIQARERRFRALIENAPDGIALLGIDGKLQQVTPSTEQILGYTLEEAQGQDPALLTHPDDLPIVIEQLSDLIPLPGKVVSLVYRFRHKDGSWHWLNSTISNLLAEPSVQAIVFNYRDITKSRQAEESLRDSEQRFRNLFENTPVSIWEEDFSAVKTYLEDLRQKGIPDLKTYLDEHPETVSTCLSLVKLLDVNQASLRLHEAVDKAELLTNLQGTFVPESFDTFKREMIAIANGEQQLELDVEVRTLTGQKRDATMNWAVVPGHEATYARVLVSLVDITERKRAEKELQEKERLLSEAQRIGHIGSWSYEIAANALQFSDEMYRLLDVSLKDFPHTWEGLLSVISSSDQNKVSRWMDGIKAGRQPGEMEFLVFHKNGELRYIRCRGAIEFDTAGRPSCFIATAQDVTERKLAEIQIRQQIEHLTALRKIDRAISSSFDLNVTLDILISQVISQLHVDAADILLLEPDGNTLTYATGQGFRTHTVDSAQLRTMDSQAGQAVREGRLIYIESLRHNPDKRLLSPLGASEGFESYVGVPLIVKGSVKGVLEVFHRLPLYPYEDWLDFLNTLAGQAAIAFENATLFEGLEESNRELAQAYDATIEGWSRALDLRDRETEGHTQRVTSMTIRLARTFGFAEEKLLYIRWGALLHDIGKMGVPDQILLKPSKLTEEEWVWMKSHPEYAYHLLKPIAFLAPALDIPYCHHEKWDGTGYPRNLKGEQIPLEARLFAVVDVWDAVTSDRPYRKAWSKEEAVEYIKDQSGKHFDPEVVSIFLNMLAEM
jgi:PAS domain S-box-containing protein